MPGLLPWFLTRECCRAWLWAKSNRSALPQSIFVATHKRGVGISFQHYPEPSGNWRTYLIVASVCDLGFSPWFNWLKYHFAICLMKYFHLYWSGLQKKQFLLVEGTIPVNLLKWLPNQALIHNFIETQNIARRSRRGLQWEFWDWCPNYWTP